MMKNKQSLYFIVGNFVYLLAQWALTVIVVRFSTNYQTAGILALATTIAGIFYIIACYGLRAYQVSDVTGKYSDQSYILSRIVTVAVALVACLVYVVLLGYDGAAIRAILIYMVYRSFEAASDVFYGVFQNNDRNDYICISMCAKGILSLVMFAACFALGFSLEVALLAMVIVAALIFVLMDLRWCRRYTKPFVYWTKENWKKTMRLLWSSALMVVLLISQPLLMSIPRLYFEQHFSTEMLGAYSSISAPTFIVSTLVSCALMPYLPLFAQYFHAGEKGKLYKLTFGAVLFAAGLGLPVLLGSYLFGEWGLTLLYGGSIRAYAHVLPLVVIVTTLSGITMCLNSLFVALRKLAIPSATLLAGCLLCQLVTAHLVDAYAMEGVTYALMVAQGFQILLSIVLAVYYIHKMPPTAIGQPS